MSLQWTPGDPSPTRITLRESLDCALAAAAPLLAIAAVLDAIATGNWWALGCAVALGAIYFALLFLAQGGAPNRDEMEDGHENH